MSHRDHVRAAQWARELGRACDDLEEVYLVGSRVNGDARTDSDYDFILIVSPRNGGLLTELRPGEWLTEDEVVDIPVIGDVWPGCDVFILRPDVHDPESIALFTSESSRPAKVRLATIGRSYRSKST